MGGLARGAICLCDLGAPDKVRPAVILTRTHSLRLMNHVTVAPITASIRDTPSQVPLDESDGMKHPCAVNLHQIQTIRQARIHLRVGQLSAEKMKAVGNAIRYALELDHEDEADRPYLI